MSDPAFEWSLLNMHVTFDPKDFEADQCMEFSEVTEWVTTF